MCLLGPAAACSGWRPGYGWEAGLCVLCFAPRPRLPQDGDPYHQQQQWCKLRRISILLYTYYIYIYTSVALSVGMLEPKWKKNAILLGETTAIFLGVFDAHANELKPKRAKMATLTFSRPTPPRKQCTVPAIFRRTKTKKNQRCKLPMLVADAASTDQTANYLDQLVPNHGAYGPFGPKRYN